MTTLEELLQPLRETAAYTARLVKNVGVRLDAMSLDLARDGGAIVRNAQGLVDAVRDQATSASRATPRMAKIAQHATALFARQRWLRLANAARTGTPALRDEDHRDLAARTAAYAAELRGGIAKIGQLASCRPDLVGPIWATELAKLQDEVPAIDAAAIRARIEAELGAKIDEVFAELDDTPLAAASLAQVHAATLLDGTRVVVKVQVPGIEDVIAADIAALRTIASTVGDIPGIDLPTLTAELSRALAIELDYEAEADALWAFTGGVTVPRPIAGASTKRILTMTRIEGERLTTWLERMTTDGKLDERDRLLAELVGEVAAQILVRGQVHADPHPGNFLVTTSGKLALLDFGCMLDLGKEERAAYARLVLAIAGGNHANAATELATLGFSADDPDQLVDLTSALIGALKPGAQASEVDWQAAFADQIAHVKQLGGLTIPRSFVLLGRVLASIAGLLATYKPKLEIHPLIARHLAAAITT
ncbi:MAG: AarF/ABC1/UbiB kinase family protein [Kofleriaceae bacterium]|nr:AarF/ABC1/UbiB kinase family protein [Kofleriaceae bacterium]